jgi:hypothetical protein
MQHKSAVVLDFHFLEEIGLTGPEQAPDRFVDVLIDAFITVKRARFC